MSVLDEVLCTGHGVGDVVPVLHHLEEKRTYTFARPAECGSPNTNKLNNVTALVLTLQHLFLTDYRVQLCSGVTMKCNDAILYMPQINRGRA